MILPPPAPHLMLAWRGSGVGGKSHCLPCFGDGRGERGLYMLASTNNKKVIFLLIFFGRYLTCFSTAVCTRFYAGTILNHYFKNISSSITYFKAFQTT